MVKETDSNERGDRIPPGFYTDKVKTSIESKNAPIVENLSVWGRY